MSFLKQGIPPVSFYGGNNQEERKIEEIIIKENFQRSVPEPKFMTRLLGPTRTWKIFKKQQDCIDCCLSKRNGLMPFAFEDINGRRMFLAAHPQVFWGLNSNRFFADCSTYEIVREYSACKLYLDIEYDYEFNKGKSGQQMLNNLIKIINFNFVEHFNLICEKKDVLDLDSSSEVKFSHHVIYQIKKIAFQNNYAAGSFIKQICGELKRAFLDNESGDKSSLQTITEKYKIPQNEILELFVTDRKGHTKLLIDEGVYTKNRHFRLLGSSKRGKNTHLKISETNEYKPKVNNQQEYFLDSLVTHFSESVERVLEFGDQEETKTFRISKCSKPLEKHFEQALFPQLDLFILQLISPNGTIRKKTYFGDSSTVVYEIQGFRYCQNIQREHKSNNIKYVVDLECFGFYQKCFDPDCSDFRSKMKPLPEEICFLFASECEKMSEEDFEKILEQMENDCVFEDGIPDEDLLHVADCAEEMAAIDFYQPK